MLPRLFHVAKEQGANKLLTNCPPCILSLKQGRELMRETGESVECGIFDFCKVFSRAFGEEVDGAGGSLSGRWGMSPRPRHPAMNCEASDWADNTRTYSFTLGRDSLNIINYHPYGTIYIPIIRFI